MFTSPHLSFSPTVPSPALLSPVLPGNDNLEGAVLLYAGGEGVVPVHGAGEDLVLMAAVLVMVL